MRRWLTALVTGTLAGALAGALPAMAQVLIFTLVGTPLTVTQGQSTDFSFTATNLDPTPIACVEVLLPSEFWISGLGTPVASNGAPWSAALQDNWVLVHSDDGVGKLNTGDSVTFTVTALATEPGVFLWENHVHDNQGCDDTNLYGPSLAVTVLPYSGLTPSPTATEAPTPAPTPASTPTPTATHAPTATPTPAATPRATPASTPPVNGGPTPRPGEPSPSPDASASARPSPPAPAPSSGGTGSGGPDAVRVAPLDAADGGTGDLGVGLDVLALLDGPFVWIVPGAAVGVPGLLVLVFVALQAMGAMAWIPAVRRLGGDDRRRRRVSSS